MAIHELLGGGFLLCCGMHQGTFVLRPPPFFCVFKYLDEDLLQGGLRYDLVEWPSRFPSLPCRDLEQSEDLAGSCYCFRGLCGAIRGEALPATRS